MGLGVRFEREGAMASGVEKVVVRVRGIRGCALEILDVRNRRCRKNGCGKTAVDMGITPKDCLRVEVAQRERRAQCIGGVVASDRIQKLPASR